MLRSAVAKKKLTSPGSNRRKQGASATNLAEMDADEQAMVAEEDDEDDNKESTGPSRRVLCC